MRVPFQLSVPMIGLILAAGLSRADSEAGPATKPNDPEQIIQAVKSLESSIGIKPTGNFSRTDARVAAYYRCYYTGKLELPESYNELQLREGSQNGCSLDENKYDVFFYPIEAVASGHAPVTEALRTAPVERIATVVPHEDFHSQVQKLPDPIAEAAATLVGFMVGATVIGDAGKPPQASEAEIFMRKADIVNRYYSQLREIYAAAEHRALSTQDALDKKRSLFAALQQECTSIQAEPRSFNKCVSAFNNAGLTFDYTYTKYYPAVFQTYLACKQDSKCTVEAIQGAPKNRSEAEVAAYLEAFARAH